MILSESLIRVSTDGTPAQIPVTPGNVTHAMLSDLLHTDVTERLRVSVNPLPDADGAVLCFFIDARGGDRQLAANPLGTCLYHRMSDLRRPDLRTLQKRQRFRRGLRI